MTCSVSEKELAAGLSYYLGEPKCAFIIKNKV